MTDLTLRIANYVKELEDTFNEKQKDIEPIFEDPRFHLSFKTQRLNSIFDPEYLFRMTISEETMKCFSEDVVRNGDIEFAIEELKAIQNECSTVIDQLKIMNEMFVMRFFDKMNSKIQQLKESL